LGDELGEGGCGGGAVSFGAKEEGGWRGKGEKRREGEEKKRKENYQRDDIDAQAHRCR